MAAKKKAKSTKKKTQAKKKAVKKSTKKAAAKKTSAKKASPKKKAASKKVAKKKAATKKTAKKAVPKKAVKKTAKKVGTKKKKAPVTKAAAPKASKGPEETKSTKAKAASPKSKVDDRRSKAKAAMLEALEEEQDSSEEDEVDPEAFFAASGGQGIFRAHVMRKERVDLNIYVRFRVKGPLVHQAELINLSKEGMCLKTKEVLEEESVLKVEIPLPHTSELFSIQVKVIWSQEIEADPEQGDSKTPIHTGARFMPMSLAKQSVINTFIQQRRDEIIMAKIGLDKFSDSAPVAGVD